MSGQAVGSEADELLRGAHRRSYRFPVELEGFRAALAWSDDGDEGEGVLTVRLGGEPVVSVDGAPEDGWVTRELRSIIAHRSARPYEACDGAVAKEVVGASALGARIQLEDPLDSSYVIGEGRIALVSRTHAGERFTIAVQQRGEAADGTEAPTAFAVAYWDEDGGLLRSEAYADRYVELGGALLPAGRTVVVARDGGLTVRRLELTAHEPVAAGEPR